MKKLYIPAIISLDLIILLSCGNGTYADDTSTYDYIYDAQGNPVVSTGILLSYNCDIIPIRS